MQDLWVDLGALRQALAETNDFPPHQLICVCWIPAGLETELVSAWVRARHPDLRSYADLGFDFSPAEVDPDWLLLGYDVADAYLYSPLADAYAWGEEDDPRVRMGAKLKECPLFPNVSDAQVWLDTLDAAPESSHEASHRPFFIYALYGVPE